MENRLYVKLSNNPMKLGADLFIYRKEFNGDIILLKDGKEIKVDPQTQTEPTLYLTTEMLQGFEGQL